MTMFQRALRRRVVMKIALVGASGSGKTFSALRLAAGLGGRVALLDTENRRASFYADRFEFDGCDLAPPYTVEAYRRAIHGAQEAGYDILVIDSLSHAWAGTGGLLEKKDSLDRRSGGNSFANWQPITQEHEQLKSAILESPLHIIATMRAKADYVVETVGGRQVPRKVGLAAVQREGIEYEFALVFKLGADTIAVQDKDNTGLFFSHNAQLTEEDGRRIRDWIESGSADVAPAAISVAPVPVAAESPARAALIAEYARLRDHVKAHGEKLPALSREMTDAEIEEMIDLGRAQAQALEEGAGESVAAPTPAVASPPGEEPALVCGAEGCGKKLTRGQYEVSLRAYQQPLCPVHQKAAQQAAA